MAKQQADEFLYDRRHFVTPIESERAGVVAGSTEVVQVLSLRERYSREVEFTPADVGVDLWVVPESEPVLDVIEGLRESGVDARPLYLFGFEGHWSLEPGAEPARREPFGTVAIPPVTTPAAVDSVHGGELKAGTAESIHVGVVDGGFSATLPAAKATSAHGEIDDDDAMGIHGSLVVSLIEIIAPDAMISFFPVPELTKETEVPLAHWSRVAGKRFRCTDEMAVAAAISRAADAGARYVNLSLGTYIRDLSLGSSEAAPVEACSVQWAIDTLPHGVEVIAAAGNDRRGNRRKPAFYPACRTDVTAVGVSDVSNDPVLWHHGLRKRDWRDWWNIQAPGADVCGAPFDGATSEAVRWSGSSFAAAVATGCRVQGIQPVAGGSAPVPVIRYSDVPGLLHVGETGPMTKTPSTASP